MATNGFHNRHLFIRRLTELYELSADDERALLHVLGAPTAIPKARDIIADGSAPRSVSIIVSGVACRYKVLSASQRQILGFLLPGDVADDFAGNSTSIDHGVSAATNCVVERISRTAFLKLMDEYRNLARALWRYHLVQASIYRSWLINMRRRSAPERVAHLFCEQFIRLQAVDLAEQGRPIPFHVVQADLADATGMSAIHVNRTLQYLRSRQLIGRSPLKFEILDWEGLKELADFDPNYLQFAREDRPPHQRVTNSSETGCGRSHPRFRARSR
jgi:CRP-like cAMP-binding protein